MVLEYPIFDVRSQKLVNIQACLELIPGRIWRFTSKIHFSRLSAAPVCSEDEEVLPGVRLEVLREREKQDTWLAWLLLLCLCLHLSLFVLESDWRKLFRNFSIYKIFEPDRWWPGGMAPLNTSILVVYLTLVVHVFLARRDMARTPCIVRGHDEFQGLGRLVLYLGRVKTLLVCLGFLMAAKFCTQVFHHVRRTTLVQLATYLAFLLLAMAAFSVVLHHQFGAVITAYNSPWNAFFGMYLAFLGEIDMYELTFHSPILGTFIFAFIFFIFAIIMFFFLVEVICDAGIEEEAEES